MWSQIRGMLSRISATTIRTSQNAVINLTKTVFACVVKYISRSSWGLWSTLLESESALWVHGSMYGLWPCVTQMKVLHSSLSPHSTMMLPTAPMTDINKWEPPSLMITFPSSSEDSTTIFEIFWYNANNIPFPPPKSVMVKLSRKQFFF